MTENRIKKIEDSLRVFPDFPQKGINFRDIFSLTKQPELLDDCVKLLVEHIRSTSNKVDAIVGLDARGFIFGSLIAHHLHLPFVPVRKRGKLPGETIHVKYSLEYGEGSLEIQSDACTEGQKVIVVDDLLATGGTLKATVDLVRQLKADVLECIVVMELRDLKGREKVPALVWSLIKA